MIDNKMDVLSQQTKDFSERIYSDLYHNDKELASELDSEIYIHSTTKAKLRFLDSLEKAITKEFTDHNATCKNSNGCRYTNAYNKALFYINQRREEQEEYLPVGEKRVNHFFENGQHFDALSEISKIFESAKKEIWIVDGYVNEKTLSLIQSKAESVNVKIITDPKAIDDKLKTFIDAFNKQYKHLELKSSSAFHDRFIIIDGKAVYHFGASLKDAGNNTFMFTQLIDNEMIELAINKFNKEWN